MSLQALKNQLVHDLRVSWKKTATLSVLLIVGLCLWLPPLWRMAFGGSTARGKPARPAHGRESAPAAHAGGLDPNAAGTSAETKHRLTWKNADAMLQTDPLLQTAELSRGDFDPFRMDFDQFSPPVLFAEEPQEAPAQAAAKTQTTAAKPGPPTGLVLKSTFVSSSRRAAFINRRLYYEGSEIEHDGGSYRLAAVHPRKVVLTRGNAVYELEISSRSSKDNPPE